MAGLFSALKHEVKSAALEATGLENISDLIKQNPNDIHMLLSFLIVLAYPTSGGDQTSPDAQKRDKYMSQLKNQNNAQMVINSIFRHLNTILSLTVDTPLSGYAASILDSVSFSPIKQEKNNAKAAVNAQQNGNGILKGGAGAPVDKNNGKRIAILRGLGIVFKLIDKKKLDYIATYSADTSAILKSTISNVKELLSSSIPDKAEEDTKLIENILNTVNYDLGFVQSKIINETDIRSFTNISEFVEFLDTQKKAAQQLLEVMQKAGPLRKIFDNMTDDDTDNDTKTKLIKHYESSFDSIVTWLSSYIENQAPYIAQLVEGSKSAQAATTSKGSGETAAGQTATTPGMAPGMPPGMMPGMGGMPMGGMMPGMPMGGMPAGMPAGMPMGGMMPGMPAGMPAGMPMGGMPMGGMPMGGMPMGGMPMGGMPMGGMPMGGMPMGGMPMGGMPMGGMPMGGMPMGGMPMGGMPMGYAGGSKKTLKHKKGKGKNNKHFTIKNKKVHNKNA